MKIVVIGGSGLIGSRVVSLLRGRGHEVVAASPRTGVNAVTGDGLADALRGARVVVDVANSPSFEAEAARAFFESVGRNLAAAESAAGVRHHVALSVVGTERLQESGYFRAKLAQEQLIQKAGVPFTIVRATQFFEFVSAVADDAAADGKIRASTGMMQPMAADDVAAFVAEAALAEPANGVVEVAGPEAFRIDEIIRTHFASTGDSREITPDKSAKYFGLTLDERALMPGVRARIAPTRFAEWLRRSERAPQATTG